MKSDPLTQVMGGSEDFENVKRSLGVQPEKIEIA